MVSLYDRVRPNNEPIKLTETLSPEHRKTWIKKFENCSNQFNLFFLPGQFKLDKFLAIWSNQSERDDKRFFFMRCRQINRMKTFSFIRDIFFGKKQKIFLKVFLPLMNKTFTFTNWKTWWWLLWSALFAS